MEHCDNPDNCFSGITEKTIKRYNARYSELGRNVKSLGWGNEEQQITRFSQLLRLGIIFEERNVLDIGCGFGDLLSFFNSKAIKLNTYNGWDINSDFIKEAKSIHRNNNNAYFFETNVLDFQPHENKNNVDIAVMLGLINYNWKHEYDSIKYAYTMIKKAFTLVNDVLIFDFLSNRIAPSYPKEDSVVYFCPEDILRFALGLTSNVILLHDYMPIPQKEGMVAMFKEKETNTD